jgi:phosphohistidine phosphatase SixA
MKILVSLFLGLLIFSFAAGNLFAQKREITIILLRHAEKDLSDDLNDPDPELSEAGKERARKLAATIKKYKPQAIYSSNFKRTRYTVTPLAEQINPGYRTMIQIYDHTKLNDLVNRMMASGVKSIVVAGHNSTTPALANLLIKQNKYKSLAETEYDKIWIIKIKRGKTKDEVIIY